MIDPKDQKSTVSSQKLTSGGLEIMWSRLKGLCELNQLMEFHRTYA